MIPHCILYVCVLGWIHKASFDRVKEETHAMVSQMDVLDPCQQRGIPILPIHQGN